MKNEHITEGEDMRVESVVEQNIASMVHELTNRPSTTLIERQGNDLVIKMSNGEEVIVESFFIAFSETQFHEMQAGVYGQDAPMEVVEVAEVADTGADEAANDQPAETHGGDAGGMGAVIGGVVGLAALGGMAGGGGGGGSSDDDDDDDDVATPPASPQQAAAMDLEDEEDQGEDKAAEEAAELVAAEDGDANISQEEFAALMAVDGEATVSDETVEAEAAPAGDDEAMTMAQFDMAPADTHMHDMSQQADVI